ncbi:MAG: phosphatidylserine decarboxylase family protein [Thermodesulfovibrionales bacterium]|nr:phosphatidylserine decarboxylase family protein [Thermodesulfovibrionales bacterium]
MKLASEGYPYIIVSAAIASFALFFSTVAAVLLFFLTIFFAYFFRDPERAIPTEKDVLVSPADGKIIVVNKIMEKEFLNCDCQMISIFMSPLNVHVNRVPCDCKIVDVKYKKGKFLSAFKPEASFENESISILIDTEYGQILLRQIAGFVARRAVCRANIGDNLKRGERFGIIKFSSRVDIFIPLGFRPTVNLNDKVLAGNSIIAQFTSK